MTSAEEAEGQAGHRRGERVWGADGRDYEGSGVNPEGGRIAPNRNKAQDPAVFKDYDQVKTYLITWKEKGKNHFEQSTKTDQHIPRLPAL